MNSIKINGKEIFTRKSGSNIMVIGNKIKIDGKEITDFSEIQSKEIKIEIIGNIESLNTTNGDVVVTGDVENIETTNGNVIVEGNVYKIKTLNGDIYKK